jgi:hypothetical protein
MKTFAAIVVLVGLLIFLTFAAVMPDSVIDLVLVAQFGELSPGRCLGAVANVYGGTRATTPAPALAPAPLPQARPHQQQVAPVPQAPNDPEQQAVKETEIAINDCRAKRLAGELHTFTASVQCSNPRITRAFSDAKYRYPDLIEWFTNRRLEIAARMDRGEWTEAQGQQETQKTSAWITEVERRRDLGQP